MVSPLCEVKDGAGAYVSTTDGVDVTPGNTITIHLIDTSADTWSISCVYTDDLSDAATVTSGLTINTVAKTATFTAPSAGRAYIFRSVVNNGVANGRNVSSYSTTFGVYTLTSGGFRVLASNETTEGDATFGWISNYNALVRGGGSLAGGSDNQVQYNNGGTLGGNAGLTINESSNRPVMANGLELTDGAYTMIVDGTPTASRTVTLPNATTTLVGRDTTDTLTSKTLSAPIITGGAEFDSDFCLVESAGSTGFNYSLLPGTIAADWNLTLPAITSNDTLAALSLAQTLSAKTLVDPILKTAGGVAFRVNNPADTYAYSFAPAAIAANRTISLPLLAGNDTMVCESFAATLANKTINATDNTITDTSTAAGDILKSNGTKFVRLARGTADYVLKTNAGGTDVEYGQVVNASVASNAAIDYSKLGVGAQSVGAQSFESTVDANGTETSKLPVSAQTTDATETTLDSFSVGSYSDDTTIVWTVVVAAIKSDGSQGAAYSRTAAFRLDASGPTLTQIGTTQAGFSLEDDADWDCDIDNSGTTVRCRVTGKAATTIRWTVISSRLEVIP